MTKREFTDIKKQFKSKNLLISENKMDIEKFLQKVEQENLKNIVQSISIPRHGWYNYEALLSVANFI